MNTHPSQEGRCGIGLILYACVVHVCHVYLVRMCTDLYIISVPRVFIHSVNLHLRSYELTHAHAATERNCSTCDAVTYRMRTTCSCMFFFSNKPCIFTNVAYAIQ